MVTSLGLFVKSYTFFLPSTNTNTLLIHSFMCTSVHFDLEDSVLAQCYRCDVSLAVWACWFQVQVKHSWFRRDLKEFCSINFLLSCFRGRQLGLFNVLKF